MKESEIELMERMEHTYWWHQGKRLLIRSMLDTHRPQRGGTILDYGCGTGENVKLLKE